MPQEAGGCPEASLLLIASAPICLKVESHGSPPGYRIGLWKKGWTCEFGMFFDVEMWRGQDLGWDWDSARPSV